MIDSSKTLDEYQKEVLRLIREGHPARAFELAREGLYDFPDDALLLYRQALALARGGNVTKSREIVNVLLQRDLSPELVIETLALEARLDKDVYDRLKDPDKKRERALLSAEKYKRAYEQSDKDTFPGINAAAMFLLGEDRVQSKAIAKEVTDKVEAMLPAEPEEQHYWMLATLGEGYLLQGDVTRSMEWYKKAIHNARAHNATGDLVPMVRDFSLIKDKLGLTVEFFTSAAIGSVVVFSGHLLDDPGASLDKSQHRFPNDPTLEQKVSEAIDEQLDQLNATVGYSSVACGSDVLFCEAMLRRGKELHVVLPFDLVDFRFSSVDFGLDSLNAWQTRVEAILQKASKVHYSTRERYLEDHVLFDFVNAVTQGLALLHAARRCATPRALVVVDQGSRHHPGGTRTFMERWEQTGSLPAVEIDLRKIRMDVKPKPVRLETVTRRLPPEPTRCDLPRTLKAMIFGDVKDFSKLREEKSPEMVCTLSEIVSDLIKHTVPKPLFQNTWGDGLFLVLDNVLACADFALRLQEKVQGVDWRLLGLQESTPLRLGLHYGPVFQFEDKIINKPNYCGSHVNRTARIEPVTAPGCAFASEQFAACLQVTDKDKEFVCEFIGDENLAKGYDRCTLYRLDRR